MAGIMLPYLSEMGQMGYVTPNTIPNLNIWYNASATTTVVNGVTQTNFTPNGSNQVTVWNDISGGSHPSSTKGGSAYVTYVPSIQNGLSALQYAPANSSNLDINPVNGWLSSSVTGLTVYAVARPTTLSTLVPLVVTDTELGVWWNGTNWSVGQSVGNFGTVTVTNDTSKFHIYGVVFDGTQTGNANRLQFRYDRLGKTLSYTGTVGANAGSPGYFYFGGDSRSSGVGGATFASKYLTGYIGEVLIWTRALSASELASVEIYLNQKWGLGLT